MQDVFSYDIHGSKKLPNNWCKRIKQHKTRYYSTKVTSRKNRRKSQLTSKIYSSLYTMHTHYFDNNFHSDTRYTLQGSIANKDMPLQSTAGVFSAKQFDTGTCILLESMYAHTDIHKQGGRRLDLCSGYGIVGARRLMDSPEHKRYIHGVEINDRAVACAQKNRENANHTDQQEYELHTTDAQTRLQTHTHYYDLIAVNPPFACGKKRCQQLLSHSLQSLTPEGSIRIVLATRR